MKTVGGDHWNKFIQRWMQNTKLSPLVNKTVLKIRINVGVNEKKESLYLILLFLGVMNIWKGFKIRVKRMEIKSAEINAAL